MQNKSATVRVVACFTLKSPAQTCEQHAPLTNYRVYPWTRWCADSAVDCSGEDALSPVDCADQYPGVQVSRPPSLELVSWRTLVAVLAKSAKWMSAGLQKNEECCGLQPQTKSPPAHSRYSERCYYSSKGSTRSDIVEIDSKLTLLDFFGLRPLRPFFCQIVPIVLLPKNLKSR